MAYTVDQQFQIDFENARHQNMMQAEDKRAKLEAIRLAKETLVENARNKPMDDREITAEDILAFAAKLAASVNE